LHSNVAPVARELNSNVALRSSRVPVGPASIVVSGSTRTVIVAVSVPPKPSAAWIEKESVPAKPAAGV
jgi:hypothetical protein